ncbi:MAG TPA: FlgD immunoglobulin-like domain containing protein, partial [Spirochaetia bacterium]|nr:FlgD immunoglobulin-like domain containing protein [Spirochaetia bacterium]
MKSHAIWAAGVLLTAALLACKTTPPAQPVAPAALSAAPQSAVQPAADGLAPAGAPGHTTLGMALTFGGADLVKSWTLEIQNAAGTVKSWTGDGTTLPSSVSWDGRNDSGATAPEGSYTARLSVDYQKNYESSIARSPSFVLDLTPPTGSVSFDPSQLTPGPQGIQPTATISIAASSTVARMDSWSLDILAPNGKTFRSFAGKWPTTTATWDGTSTNGMPVAPSTTYSAVATVQDEFGLSAELRDTVAVAEIPNAPQQAMVQPRLSGFSPVSATMARTIDLLVSIGNQGALKSWKLELLQSELGEEKQWSGDASSVPSVITWDGTMDTGGLAPEGIYTAVLDVDYGEAFQPVQVKSSSFILDVSPPTATLSASPSALTPNGSGGIEPESIGVTASSKVASIQSWSLDVVGPGSTPVATFSGLDPKARVPWDGSLTGGGQVDPTRSYALQAKIQDVYGNVGLVQVELPGGALPQVTGTVAATARLVGFSPMADSLPQAQTITLSLGQDTSVSAWTLS